MDEHNIKQHETLELLEKFNFRIYICPGVTKRSDTDQSRLFNWAHQLYIGKIEDLGDRDELNKYIDIMSDDWRTLNALEKIKRYLKGLINFYCSSSEFVKSLTLDIDVEYDYYHWRGLKFFLANYESELAENKEFRESIGNYFKPKDEEDLGNNSYEREHIWAQNNRKEIKNSDHEKSRLGNFVLLHKITNIVASDSDLAQIKSVPIKHQIQNKNGFKIENYMEFGNKQFRQVEELREYHKKAKKFVKEGLRKYGNRYFDYYQSIIDMRETKLIRFAFKRWGIDDEERIIKYNVNSKKGEEEHHKDKEHKKVYFQESK